MNFGQFVMPTPKTPEQKLEEGILMAFGRGEAAARRGKEPNGQFKDYRPEYEQAYKLGYQEGLRGK